MPVEQRLFFGVVNMIENQPGKTTIHTERYCAWLGSQDEARGRWVSHALEKNAGLTVCGCFVDDITDIATLKEIEP